MFHNARIRLTLWYVFIIMLISSMFSAAFYQVSTREVRRALDRMQFVEKHQFQMQIPRNIFIDELSLDLLKELKTIIMLRLLTVNGIIFLFSTGLSYVVAGRTLSPIQKMHDEQKQFISDASHELRTPLTTLRAMTEEQMLHKKSLTKAHLQYVQNNLDEIKSLQKLTDSLLDLSSIESNKNLYEPSLISLTQVFNRAQKNVMQLAKKKQIIITSTLSDEVVLFDDRALQQLFTIILDNAIKYSREKSEVVVSNMQKGKYVQVQITDQGIGIPQSDKLHVFKRLFRSDRSRTKSDGFGLGLSIAKKLADKNNARISLVSKVNQGTTVTLSIPRAA